MTKIQDPEDFPALYQSADQASLAAQTRFLRTLRVRLIALLVAAAGGATAVTTGGVRAGAVVALVAFFVAIGVEWYSAVVRPERVWYEGRAAAESAKTLAWRYMVRGESFEEDRPEADKEFLNELREILMDLDSLDVGSPQAAHQITSGMRAVRTSDFDARKSIYLSERIENQREWYARKAEWNGARANRWTLASIALQMAGVVAGAGMAFGSLDFDALGILAAGAATISAWAQAKQYQNLATAYGITAQELAAVASEGEMVTAEPEWSAFVGQAEEAISREHTLWRASRGLRIRPQRGRMP